MTARWERPDPNQNHWLYCDAEDRVVGEVWQDGIVWEACAGDTDTLFPARYLTELAAKKAVEQAYAT